MTVIEAPRPATPLDLDLMARIAEEAGRDAFRKPAAQATFDANPTLRTLPASEDMRGSAARLYRACLSGATDPSAD